MSAHRKYHCCATWIFDQTLLAVCIKEGCLTRYHEHKESRQRYFASRVRITPSNVIICGSSYLLLLVHVLHHIQDSDCTTARMENAVENGVRTELSNTNDEQGHDISFVSTSTQTGKYHYTKIRVVCVCICPGA